MRMPDLTKTKLFLQLSLCCPPVWLFLFALKQQNQYGNARWEFLQVSVIALVRQREIPCVLNSCVFTYFHSHHTMLFFFSSLICAGDHFWIFREAILEPGYPLELVDYGRDIPYDKIETAIWWEPSGYTYLFKGDR